MSDRRCGYEGLKYRTVFVLMVLSYSSLMVMRNVGKSQFTFFSTESHIQEELLSVPRGNTLFLSFLNLLLVYLYAER